MTPTAMPNTEQGTALRRRVVAIGSGLGGLTATRALKHGEVGITDALVFLTRMTAQGASHVAHQTSLWQQVTPTTAGALATSGALVTLYVAITRAWKRSPRERAHPTQTDALYSADQQRYETASLSNDFSCGECLWLSKRTRKGC